MSAKPGRQAARQTQVQAGQPKRIQGARGYARLRKADVDRRFPGLLDSVVNADGPALV